LVLGAKPTIKKGGSRFVLLCFMSTGY